MSQNFKLPLKPIFHRDAKTLALDIPTCWYLKTLKFALPPTPNLKYALPPTRTPNVNQWNIGHVGSPMQNILWNMGFRKYSHQTKGRRHNVFSCSQLSYILTPTPQHKHCENCDKANAVIVMQEGKGIVEHDYIHDSCKHIETCCRRTHLVSTEPLNTRFQH